MDAASGYHGHNKEPLGSEKSGVHQCAGDPRSACSSGGGPDGNQRKEAISALFGVEIGCISPELRDHEYPEHADPEIENDARVRKVFDEKAGLNRPEDRQVRYAEKRGARNKVAAPPSIGKPAVEPYHRDKQKALPEARVGLDLHFGKSGDIGNGDPSLPQGLDEVIGAQNEKDVGEHQQGGDAFPCMYIREKTKKSIQLGRFHRASDPFIVPMHDPVAKDPSAAIFQRPL